MNNRISAFEDEMRAQETDGPQPIGEILAELLAKYEARFPQVHIAVGETPVAAY
jgi:hypothetical protein